METEKGVALRPFEKKDIEQCVNWGSDQDMRSMMRPSNPRPRSREVDEAWYTKLINDPGTRIFSIESDNGFIGVIYITRIDLRNRNALLSVMIGEKRDWDKGCGTQAIRQIKDIAFNELGLHKLFLYVASYNKRAIKVYEKSGFVVEGELKEHLVVDGNFEDWVVMSLFNNNGPGV